LTSADVVLLSSLQDGDDCIPLDTADIPPPAPAQPQNQPFSGEKLQTYVRITASMALICVG